MRPVQVLIPAKGTSYGLPHKNIKVMAGRPLIEYSIVCAHQLSNVAQVVVSTDDPEIAEIARQAGAQVPELRPRELALPTTPMAEVVSHACKCLFDASPSGDSWVLLLDPTSPLREPETINATIAALEDRTNLDGAVSISVPSFNPIWVGVHLQEDGTLRRHQISPSAFGRRQDVPAYWRINGSFYIWRISFARSLSVDWLDKGLFMGVETPESLSHSIDVLDDFRLVETLIRSRLVELSWLDRDVRDE